MKLHITPYPNVYLKSALENQNIPINQFSLLIGLKKEEGINLLNNNLPITNEIALRISKLLGHTPEYWKNTTKT